MNIDATCTCNFNIPHGNDHATCIEINMAWKSFGIACKTFSTSQMNNDTKYIKLGISLHALPPLTSQIFKNN